MFCKINSRKWSSIQSHPIFLLGEFGAPFLNGEELIKIETFMKIIGKQFIITK
jgi:hypothetical protein